jgi:hypothetical protein
MQIKLVVFTALLAISFNAQNSDAFDKNTC